MHTTYIHDTQRVTGSNIPRSYREDGDSAGDITNSTLQIPQRPGTNQFTEVAPGESGRGVGSAMGSGRSGF